MHELEFLFDFASPNAYLVHRALPQIIAATGVRVRPVPVLLGGIFKAIGNQSPLQTYGHIGAKVAYDQLEKRRFMQKYGIANFVMNPHFPVNSLLMMRGAVAARQLGCEAAYDDAIYAGMWEQGLKLDLQDVWERALTAAGLPTAELGQLVADPAIKASLATQTEQAVARGVFGIPSFIVDGELWFGKERLRDAVEAATA